MFVYHTLELCFGYFEFILLIINIVFLDLEFKCRTFTCNKVFLDCGVPPFITPLTVLRMFVKVLVQMLFSFF